MSIPVVTVLVALLMMAAERRWPDHALPTVPGWLRRVLLVDLAQVLVVVAWGVACEPWLTRLRPPTAAGLGPVGGSVLGYLVATFFYYWWHRLRHEVPALWRGLHQLHHSPRRLEVLTSFYKHPLEIAANMAFSAALLYGVLGLAPVQVAGVALLATSSELFYHCNIRTPRWLGWFIQRPEMHKLHHGAGMHACNYGDLPLWDRLFGTHANPATFDAPCGFGDDELRLGEMLAFRDVSAAHTDPAAHPDTRSTLRALGRRVSPRARAVTLVAVGALAMTGDALGWGAVTGLGLATGASPYPKVFTTRDDLESFSSAFTLRWTEGGEAHEVTLTPELNARLAGPYNRRNPYGAAMAGGPLLSTGEHTRALHAQVVDYAFCRDDGLLQELGLATHPEDIELVVQPLPWAPPTRLPLTLAVSC